MLKPILLCKTLMEAVPEFRNDPDKLKLYVEHGNIVSTLAPSLSHEYQYTLSVTVINFGGSVGSPSSVGCVGTSMTAWPTPTCARRPSVLKSISSAMKAVVSK
ncbi:phage tail protein [Serratia marcescens]|uniref:phage tail protein n=1 Tax=Serratia marcescens TaxID=615 RepID=UPI003D36BA1F